MIGNSDLLTFVQDNAAALLSRAYLEDCGCWANGLRRGGDVDVNKLWWIYSELDQFAGTLALRDSKFTRYLPRAYDYWFRHFVDTTFGEVWNGVDGRTHAPMRQMAKQWAWKSAYHSFEHALIGYIVAQQLHNRPVTLYYAFPSDVLPHAVQPYFYAGTIRGFEVERDNQGQRVQKVTFSNVQ
jgi:hypothetical protein